MAKPIGDLLNKLGPEVDPFERHNRNNPSQPPRKVGEGEDKSYDDFIKDCTDGEVGDIIITTKEKLDFFSKYLWIINKEGLFIILESTENLDAARKVVCHSNITKGDKALQGGELWFLNKKSIVLNYSSGRYGAETILQEDAVIEYFESLGFKVEIQ